MAEPSTETHAGHRGRAWEKNSTRVAILEAARRLAAREGVEAVTLGRVAAEAGFAPPAVYAFFASKDELHVAVVAEDLDRLARAMRGEDLSGERESSEEPDAAEQPAADIIAFHPANSADESGEPDAPAQEPEQTGESQAEPEQSSPDIAEPSVAEHASAPHEDQMAHADGIPAAEPEPTGSVPADDGDAEASQPEAESAPDLSVAPAQISLAEIEQAMGVVLAGGGEDFGEAATVEEVVPDAFPEERTDPAQAELPIVSESPSTNGRDAPAEQEKSFVERRAQPDRRSAKTGFRSRWRRSNPESEPKSENPQTPLPLETPVPVAGEPDASATTKKDLAIAQLQEAIARLEARPVDSWLERRLRVFERTLADLEARMEKTERDSSTALTTVSESFKAIEDRLSENFNGASRQVTDSEQRHRAIAADLRLYVKDLSGRLAAVETSLSRFLSAEDGELMPAAPVRVEPEEARPCEPAPAKPSPLSEPRALHEPQGESYLSVARRAANSAAAEAERGRTIGPLAYLKMPPAPVSVSRRRLQIVAAALTLLVLAISATIWLRGRPTEGPVRVPIASASAPAPRETADARVATLAKAGNAKAELVVALKLLNGDGVATDVPSAAFWLKKSAAQHEPVAEYWLGTLYERGRGVSKDAAKAMQAYEAAAKVGNAKAMYRLGVGYAEGWDGEPDYAQAADWFAKAAQLGVIDAQFNLGVLYERGSGVPENPVQAFKWYAIAAAQGDAESKARIDALAAGLAPSKVADAQAAAAKFQPGEPDPAANIEPSVQGVAALH